MKIESTQVGPPSASTHLAFVEGLERGFDIEAYSTGFSDFLQGRPFDDGVMPANDLPIVVPPFVPDGRPLSWQASYRLGWLFASWSRN